MAARRLRLGDPHLAVAYLRASTTEQELSPEVQRATIDAWATRERKLVVSCRDENISGGAELDERKELLKALEDVRAHRAGLLVIAKRDRLARGGLYAAAIIEQEALKCGARLVSADGIGNGDTPADAMVRGMQDVYGAYELAQIRMRTKAALQAKRARGERAGEVPYGYWADKKGMLHPNGAEQVVLERVRALRCAGLSIRAIAAECARSGLLSRSGTPLRQDADRENATYNLNISL